MPDFKKITESAASNEPGEPEISEAPGDKLENPDLDDSRSEPGVPVYELLSPVVSRKRRRRSFMVISRRKRYSSGRNSETENKEEERCNKLDRRERSCFSITTKKHIHLNEKNISILPLLVRKKATCLHYINNKQH